MVEKVLLVFDSAALSQFNSISIQFKFNSSSGPVKFVNPAAGRRGCVHFHWSSTDGNYAFSDYSSIITLCQCHYENTSTQDAAIEFRKNSSVDVTVRAWGCHTTFADWISSYLCPGVVTPKEEPVSPFEELMAIVQELEDVWLLTRPNHDINWFIMHSLMNVLLVLLLSDLQLTAA